MFTKCGDTSAALSYPLPLSFPPPPPFTGREKIWRNDMDEKARGERKNGAQDGTPLP